MKQPCDSTIIICGIVRNAEYGLKHNIPVIKDVVSKFADYRVFIYENDSTDGTKAILSEWMKKDKDKVVVSLNCTNQKGTIPTEKECEGNPFFSMKRISKMALLRNHYMEFLDQLKDDFDYMMVIDLDVAQIFSDGIMSSFAEDAPNWDVVTAYGYSLSPMMLKRYHDTYALVQYGKESVPQTENSIYKAARGVAKELLNVKWKRVYSAYGGLAIYTYNLIKGLRYEAIKNNDPRVEVRCEHYSIYKHMLKRKPDLKVFINSEMKIHYQRVTPKLILKTIKKKIKV